MTIERARYSRCSRTLTQLPEKPLSPKVPFSTRADRPGLAAYLDYLREGDVMVVHALDRLGRSMVDTVTTIDRLRKQGIYVRCGKGWIRRPLRAAPSPGSLPCSPSLSAS